MDFFSEYKSPPDSVRYQFEVGKPATELARVGGDVIMREREVTAILNLQTATAVRDWLNQKIGELDAVSKEVASRLETEASHGNASD